MGAIHAENFTEALYQTAPPSIFIRDSRVRYSDDGTEREYRIRKLTRRYGDGKDIASFRARPLPGCCGVLVAYYLRPIGKNPIKTFKTVLDLIIKAAGAASYGLVLLTLPAGKESVSCSLNIKSDCVFPFTNWKTGNDLSVLYFPTKNPNPKEPKPVSFEGE